MIRDAQRIEPFAEGEQHVVEIVLGPHEKDLFAQPLQRLTPNLIAPLLRYISCKSDVTLRLIAVIAHREREQLNDVFAFCCGKLFGKRKLIPHTSPGKTWGGALGALVLTTTLVSYLGHLVFAGTEFDRLPLLIGLGVRELRQFFGILEHRLANGGNDPVAFFE